MQPPFLNFNIYKIVQPMTPLKESKTALCKTKFTYFKTTTIYIVFLFKKASRKFEKNF